MICEYVLSSCAKRTSAIKMDKTQHFAFSEYWWVYLCNVRNRTELLHTYLKEKNRYYLDIMPWNHSWMFVLDGRDMTSVPFWNGNQRLSMFQMCDFFLFISSFSADRLCLSIKIRTIFGFLWTKANKWKETCTSLAEMIIFFIEILLNNKHTCKS